MGACGPTDRVCCRSPEKTRRTSRRLGGSVRDPILHPPSCLSHMWWLAFRETTPRCAKRSSILHAFILHLLLCAAFTLADTAEQFSTLSSPARICVCLWGKTCSCSLLTFSESETCVWNLIAMCCGPQAQHSPTLSAGTVQLGNRACVSLSVDLFFFFFLKGKGGWKVCRGLEMVARGWDDGEV